MRFTSALAAVPLVAAAAAFTPASTSGTDKLALEGLVKLALYEAKHTPTPACNTATGYVRKEWSTLSSTEKTAYIDAVLCLQSKDAISGSIAPGAKSRYDDFVATHINQTLTIHGTGNFLTWHRYFTWTYEHALRNECGYTGYQPYLNWGKYALDPLDAPVFDGSATSMSGNGEYRVHSAFDIPSSALPEIVIPAGDGGGCVTTGPFANFSVNLGPLSPAFTDVPVNPQADGLGYNPRCLRRDISTYAAATSLTDKNTTDLITQYTDVGSFQTVMQGLFADGLLGVHTAGHYLVGGDPGGDLFTSPGDPYFYLHHAQIDRVYWIWQNQDLANRQNAIGGTITLDNEPASANTTLADIIELGVNAEGITIASAMSTLAGPFCYIYA
ncbi:hypothetical protein LTR36_006034 [Oleoguttula mirabilis]|uniref:Tyrosinase copper-binding domain-containing protein n=1 Tax=Oleoguttula mirabilis TaxID=1507867 RepID=A0AAV9JCG9_9PEZI|nr:hypothetical protein LTR36_006034 [Oleoguttula mirabilis]